MMHIDMYVDTKRRTVAAGLLITLLCFADNGFADYWSASKAFQDKDYEKAFVQFKELAELGHPDSQFALSTMYYNGYGVSKNLMLSYAWIRLAADAGHTKAKELEPQVRASIDAESVSRAKGLLDGFTSDAISNRLLPKIIPNCDYQDISMPQLATKIVPTYPSAMLYRGVQGSVVVELVVGADGTVRDTFIVDTFPKGAFEDATVKAVMRWKFKPALRNGQPVTSSFSILFYYNFTKGAELNGPIVDYFKKIKSDAEAGNPAAQYVHGLRIASYPEDRRPWSEAMPWFIKAAQGGLAEAQYRVGHSLLRGRGCEADVVKAREWLQRAAQQDNADAQIELARLSLKPNSSYEPKKAVFWLERAATNGNLKAKKYLATVLAASPDESLRDPKRALALVEEVLKKNRGDVESQEAGAAALAALGNYAEAVNIQKKAINAATSRGWGVTELNERLQRYKAGNPWYGDLLTF